MHTAGKEMDKILVLTEDGEGLAWRQITWLKVQGHRHKDNIYQQNHMFDKEPPTRMRLFSFLFFAASKTQ